MTDTATPIRPSAERIAKGDISIEPQKRGEGPKPAVATRQLAHDALKEDGVILMREWNAGCRFHDVYHVANGSGVPTQGWGPRIMGSSDDLGQQQSDAKRDLAKWRKQLSPVLYECLESVCGLGKSMSGWARDTNRHPASGKEVLIIALEQFAIVS